MLLIHKGLCCHFFGKGLAVRLHQVLWGAFQVTGVLATRETFLVSIYDYNKDAEEAEQAERQAAHLAEALPEEASPAAAPGSQAVIRNLSGGISFKSRPCAAAGQHSSAALQWALPAWVLVALLASILIWERRGTWHTHLQPAELRLQRPWWRLFGCGKASVLKQ